MAQLGSPCATLGHQGAPTGVNGKELGKCTPWFGKIIFLETTLDHQEMPFTSMPHYASFLETVMKCSLVCSV